MERISYTHSIVSKPGLPKMSHDWRLTLISLIVGPNTKWQINMCFLSLLISALIECCQFIHSFSFISIDLILYLYFVFYNCIIFIRFYIYFISILYLFYTHIIHSLFHSTYLCEQSFNMLKIRKNKTNSISSGNLHNCIRLCCSYLIKPDIIEIVKNKCQ